jgi:hypothetical protein
MLSGPRPNIIAWRRRPMSGAYFWPDSRENLGYSGSGKWSEFYVMLRCKSARLTTRLWGFSYQIDTINMT